jgi:hypothetical protein
VAAIESPFGMSNPSTIAGRVRPEQNGRHMGHRTWDRRLLLRRGAAAGAAAGGLILTGHTLVVTQATPAPAEPWAGCDPLAGLPPAPAARVISSDVAAGAPPPPDPVARRRKGTDRS